MKKLLALIWFVQLGILTTAIDCSPTSKSPVGSPSIGEPFSLPAGESASVEGADLSLTFSAVTEDSRCPKDVNCVVAGQAIVVFEARSSGDRTDLTFKVPPSGSDAQQFKDYTITIMELEPQPESGKRIEPSSYTARVLVAAGVS